MPKSSKPTLPQKNTEPSYANISQLPIVVGIGASAGGLEALQHFLSNVPENSGLAYVVIQHMDPTRKGVLPELLQRSTKMQVVQADNRMKVKPNCVYVIPPNKDLSILHGSLFTIEPIAPHGLRLPIDFFFRALADDQQARAIGVILSGMGSDGTLGLGAIKQKAGLTAVQQLNTAKFDGMPHSAIEAGLADIIAAPEVLPVRILYRLKGMVYPEPFLELKSQSSLEKIIILLREQTGNDFLNYKKNTLYRRIERRMGLHQISAIADYVKYLRQNPQELDLLFKELLIGVTNFFRDPQVWETLKNQTLPTLFAAYPKGKALRAWVPGCSSGEEAYSLAIIFKEALEQVNPPGRFSLQIFATDLDQDSIHKARLGLFRDTIKDDVSPERLAKYFVAEEHSGYRVIKQIREIVVFAPQNIFMDPPFTRLDILSCRNLLIYLGLELQKKLIPLFHYALCQHGILLLGNAETIGSFTHLFSLSDNKSRIYQRIDNVVSNPEVEFPTRNPPILTVNDETKMPDPITNLQTLTDRLLLQNYAPAAVLVNTDGDILYINGRTGKYLEPAAGKANWNIHAMARDGLRYELGMALNKSLHQSDPVHVPGLKVESETINLTVQAIQKPESLRGHVIIVFNVAPSMPLAQSLNQPEDIVQEQLMRELEQARNEAQSLREEMQTSQEELKSTNEELQSTNEELQSTNEELTTSKEELQSLNEELQTVNAELQSKVEDLSCVNNDMKNLLNSTEIATVFLDNAMHIRRFTTHATHLFKLIPGDVGRALSDIVTELDYTSLQHDCNEVLRSLVFIEKQIGTHDQRWFKVRIMPYRTQDNVIDGVVITFIDITDFKLLESKLNLNTSVQP